MADKEILAKIRDSERVRPWDVHASLAAAWLESGACLGVDLAEALDILGASWSTTADLYAMAKLKGAQSTYIVPLRHAAAEVAKVAAALRQPRPGTGAAAQVTTGPRSRQQQCDDPQVHERHPSGIGPVTGDTLYCLGVRPAVADVTSLDKLIADSIAEGRGGLRTEDIERVVAKMPESLSPITFPGQVSADEVTAYLSGAADTLPGLAESLVPGSVTDATAEPIEQKQRATCIACADAAPATGKILCADCSLLDDQTIAAMVKAGQDNPMPSTWESETMTADGHRTPGNIPAVPPVPLLGQPGDGGGAYDPKYIPPGGVPFTFAELMAPVPAAALPPHLSHSQMETVGECPTKYRMQRLDRMPGAAPGAVVQQIPQWALIGGNAFHAAVEDRERMLIEYPDLGHIEVDCESWWSESFGRTIAEVEQSSPVPRSLWRASKKGAEGETWWNANGPEMLRKYLAARPAEPTITVDSTGTPAIEAEIDVQVPTGYGPVPFKSILDRVTVRPDGTIVIRDYKTGDRMPETREQLAEQAWTLRLSGKVSPQAQILGTYYNARKGTWTEPVDLLVEYPWDWFVYRLTSAHAQRLALTTGPTPARVTSFCGGCSVRWACPVGGPKR